MLKKINIEEAVNGNPALSHSFISPPNRDAFWKEYKEKTFEKMISDFMYPEKEPDWVGERQKAIRKQKFNLIIRKIVGKFIYNRFRLVWWKIRR